MSHAGPATTEGGAQSIDEISGKYLGRPIEADSIRGMGVR